MAPTFVRGNLLDSDADALVNAVNTVGVMGKGIALAFKQHAPENVLAYKAACDAGTVEVGRMLVTVQTNATGPRWIINFPTKRHWRHPARVEWIDAGLMALWQTVIEAGMTSVAVPALGCGNGGLDWEEVKPRMIDALGSLTGVRVIIHEPSLGL